MENKVTIPFPQPGDYPDYYENYLSHVDREKEILVTLKEQLTTVIASLSALGEEEQNRRYSEGKWSVKEVIGHCIDTERIFSYRALCFARGETQPLPGYDENKYTPAGRFGERSLQSLLKEFAALRESNITLFSSFSAEDVVKGGVASGYKNKVNSIIYVLAGHLQHHLMILKERYGINGVK